MNVLEIILLVYFGINAVISVILFIMLRQSDNTIWESLVCSIIAFFFGLPIAVFGYLQWALGK